MVQRKENNNPAFFDLLLPGDRIYILLHAYHMYSIIIPRRKNNRSYVHYYRNHRIQCYNINNNSNNGSKNSLRPRGSLGVLTGNHAMDPSKKALRTRPGLLPAIARKINFYYE